MANKLTPEQLYELAKDKYYKVYDFDKSTKAADKKWIRVGVLPDVNKEINWNFFDGERLISEINFNTAEDFENGISIVVKDSKYNALKDNGGFVFSEWYDYVYRIEGGYIVEVKKDEFGLNREEAFADTEGNIVSEWFSQIIPMLHNNLYNVSRKTGQGVLERVQAVYDFTKREIISDWYDDLCIYTGKVKFARIRQGKLYNLISEDGKPIFKIWSKKPFNVEENGKTQVFAEDGKCYNADVKTGKLEMVV